MVEGEDWRLTGQEQYLQGATFRWQQYVHPSADWDHDHCEFCWVKFMEGGESGCLSEGYATADRRRVCTTCFMDFKTRFEWIVRH